MRVLTSIFLFVCVCASCVCDRLKKIILPEICHVSVSEDSCLSLVLPFSQLFSLPTSSHPCSLCSLLCNFVWIYVRPSHSSSLFLFSIFLFFCVLHFECFLKIWLQFTNSLFVHVYFAVLPTYFSIYTYISIYHLSIFPFFNDPPNPHLVTLKMFSISI